MNTPKKMTTYNRRTQQSGFGMVEVLVALIILLVGLLGLAGLMVQSQRSEMESYQRVQALILLQDIAARINANRAVSTCYAITTYSTGSPYLGTSGLTTLPTCTTGTAAQQTQVTNDLNQWNTLLLGAAETTGTTQVGAMIGARGCVSYDATTEIVSPSTGTIKTGTGIFTVQVAWQGMGNTFANTTSLCGKNNYSDELQRRVISLTFRLASLAPLG